MAAPANVGLGNQRETDAGVPADRFDAPTRPDCGSRRGPGGMLGPDHCEKTGPRAFPIELDRRKSLVICSIEHPSHQSKPIERAML